MIHIFRPDRLTAFVLTRFPSFYHRQQVPEAAGGAGGGADGGRQQRGERRQRQRRQRLGGAVLVRVAECVCACTGVRCFVVCVCIRNHVLTCVGAIDLTGFRPFFRTRFRTTKTGWTTSKRCCFCRRPIPTAAPYIQAIHPYM